MSFEIRVTTIATKYQFVEFWPEKSLSFLGRWVFLGLEFFRKCWKKPVIVAIFTFFLVVAKYCPHSCWPGQWCSTGFLMSEWGLFGSWKGTLMCRNLSLVLRFCNSGLLPRLYQEYLPRTCFQHHFWVWMKLLALWLRSYFWHWRLYLRQCCWTDHLFSF